MALNPTALAALIEANMLAIPAVMALPGAATTGLATAIATAVVMHITAAAEVHPEAGSPPMTVTPPGAPVAGLGTIV